MVTSINYIRSIQSGSKAMSCYTCECVYVSDSETVRQRRNTETL
jgi:hypothetical protein